MRGTWQGSGTWQTTGGGPGLGTVLAICAAAAAVYAAVSWVILWWWLVLGVAVACVVTLAMVIRWLVRWSDRRAARAWAQRPAQLACRYENCHHNHPELQPQRPAIAPQAVNFNFYGPLDTEQAAVIRQALPGTAGDAIADGKP